MSPLASSTPAPSDEEFSQLRKYIEESCGIALGDDKVYLLEGRLAGILVETGSSSFGDLYRKAVSQPALGLRDKIVDAMTTNETLWFRDTWPFEVLKENLIPKLVKSAAGRELRIWSAASSTGQEAYSIAISILESARLKGFAPPKAKILATDISPTVLFLATAGRYDQLSMSRGMPADIRDRYFTQTGNIWVLRDEVKRMVEFKKYNLQSDFRALGSFDLVFCRNVLLYFSVPLKKQVLAGIAKSIGTTGRLFLGGAETAINYSTDFEPVKYNNHIYYKCKGGGI